jgi:hypothetical protein
MEEIVQKQMLLNHMPSDGQRLFGKTDFSCLMGLTSVYFLLFSLDFLEACCDFYTRQPACLFHKYPDVAVDLLLVFSIQETDKVRDLKILFANQLNSCSNCIRVFHSAQKTCYLKYQSLFAANSMDELRKKILEWNTNRLRLDCQKLVVH